MSKGVKSLGKYILNVSAGVVETIIDEKKSIYVNQSNNTLENVKIFLTSNGFNIENIESNDSTSCEYNVHFSR